jgi:hypothetical protein
VGDWTTDEGGWRRKREIIKEEVLVLYVSICGGQPCVVYILVHITLCIHNQNCCYPSDWESCWLQRPLFTLLSRICAPDDSTRATFCCAPVPAPRAASNNYSVVMYVSAASYRGRRIQNSLCTRISCCTCRRDSTRFPLHDEPRKAQAQYRVVTIYEASVGYRDTCRMWSRADDLHTRQTCRRGVAAVAPPLVHSSACRRAVSHGRGRTRLGPNAAGPRCLCSETRSQLQCFLWAERSGRRRGGARIDRFSTRDLFADESCMQPGGPGLHRHNAGGEESAGRD